MYLLKDTVTKTAIEYTQVSSLHGIQYIFESGRNLSLSRVIWLVLSIVAAILGIVWSVEVGWDYGPRKRICLRKRVRGIGRFCCEKDSHFV